MRPVFTLYLLLEKILLLYFLTSIVPILNKANLLNLLTYYLNVIYELLWNVP